MNGISLIGRLTRNPEVRETSNKKTVCDFSIAINRGYTNEEGERGVDYINVQVWGKQAENLKKYQGKGSLIAVNGSLRVDAYQDKEGKNKYKTYVLASNIEYLGSKKEETLEASEDIQEKADILFGKDGLQNIPITDDDLPF